MKKHLRTYSQGIIEFIGKSINRKSSNEKQFITNHVISMKPDGLGRRLLSLFNALTVSQYLDCRLSVVWPENRHCNCPLSDLFSCSPDIPVYSELSSSFESNVLNIGFLGNRKSMFFGTAGDLLQYLDKNSGEPRMLTSGPKQDYSKVFNTCETVIIKMARPIQLNNRSLALDCFHDNFKIAPHIQERIDAFLHEYRFHNTLGLHIREGDIADKLNHQRYVSMEAYYEKLEEIMERKRFDSILLCTQSNAAAKLFQQKYKGRVISYPFEDYSRGSVGVQNALIDIILLSRCDLILGPKSYFNTAAALIGNKPLIKIA